MNIIELTKQILNECEIIQDFFPGKSVKVDFINQENNEQCGLISAGDSLQKKSITGIETYKHSFILYARTENISEYQALSNSNFLLELSFYLRGLKLGQEVSILDRKGILNKLECANGMQVSFLTPSVAGPCEYQLQIFATYELNPKEEK